MIYQEISIYTLIPEFYKIINRNNSSFQTYINSFYDGSVNLLKSPLTTTGSVKGSKGEFTTLVTDNLVVKKQYTNIYENSTTSNYDWYNTYVNGVTLTRDPSTWEVIGWPYLDVDKPYYKLTSSNPKAAPRCSTVSQMVEFIFSSTDASTEFSVLLDPSGNKYNVTHVSNGESVSLINVKYDVSYGSTWVVTNMSGAGTKTWVTV